MHLPKFFKITGWAVAIMLVKPVLTGIFLVSSLPVIHIHWIDAGIGLLGGAGLVIGLTGRWRGAMLGIQLVILLLKLARDYASHHQRNPEATQAIAQELAIPREHLLPNERKTKR